MKTSTTVISSLVALIVGLAVGYYVHSQPTQTGFVGAVGPAGEIQTTPRIAQLSLNGNPLGAATTTVNTNQGTLTNTDARDRVITSIEYFGTGLESNNNITMVFSTSTAATTSPSNSITTVKLSNQTDIYFTRSSAASGATTTPVIWTAGSVFNAIASSTATNATTTTAGTGIVVVKYLGE